MFRQYNNPPRNPEDPRALARVGVAVLGIVSPRDRIPRPLKRTSAVLPVHRIRLRLVDLEPPAGEQE